VFTSGGAFGAKGRAGDKPLAWTRVGSSWPTSRLNRSEPRSLPGTRHRRARQREHRASRRLRNQRVPRFAMSHGGTLAKPVLAVRGARSHTDGRLLRSVVRASAIALGVLPEDVDELPSSVAARFARENTASARRNNDGVRHEHPERTEARITESRTRSPGRRQEPEQRGVQSRTGQSLEAIE
jgi:hypothetical protein